MKATIKTNGIRRGYSRMSGELKAANAKIMAKINDDINRVFDFKRESEDNILNNRVGSVTGNKVS